MLVRGRAGDQLPRHGRGAGRRGPAARPRRPGRVPRRVPAHRPPLPRRGGTGPRCLTRRRAGQPGYAGRGHGDRGRGACSPSRSCSRRRWAPTWPPRWPAPGSPSGTASRRSTSAGTAASHQYGYSLFTARLGALLGVRPAAGRWPPWSALPRWVGCSSATGPAGRCSAGVLGALVLAGNLVERSDHLRGRVGVRAAGAAARSAPERPPRWLRLTLAAVCAALATAASPVAGLFTGLAGAALLLAALRTGDGPGRPLPGGWRAERPLARGSSWPWRPPSRLAPITFVFGNGGTQPYSAESMRINVALAVLVAVVLPRRRRVLRVGAALTVLLLLGAYYLPSPIGSNALRLPMLFALPRAGRVRRAARAVAGRAARRAVLVAVPGDGERRDPGRRRRRAPTASTNRSSPNSTGGSRPGGSRWCRCATTGSPRTCRATVPLARGWERQVDSDRNALFYDGSLNAPDVRAVATARGGELRGARPGRTRRPVGPRRGRADPRRPAVPAGGLA